MVVERYKKEIYPAEDTTNTIYCQLPPSKSKSCPKQILFLSSFRRFLLLIDRFRTEQNRRKLAETTAIECNLITKVWCWQIWFVSRKRTCGLNSAVKVFFVSLKADRASFYLEWYTVERRQFFMGHTHEISWKQFSAYKGYLNDFDWSTWLHVIFLSPPRYFF